MWSGVFLIRAFVVIRLISYRAGRLQAFCKEPVEHHGASDRTRPPRCHSPSSEDVPSRGDVKTHRDAPGPEGTPRCLESVGSCHRGWNEEGDSISRPLPSCCCQHFQARRSCLSSHRLPEQPHSPAPWPKRCPTLGVFIFQGGCGDVCHTVTLKPT